MTPLQLLDKLYFDPAFTEAARLIGYLGCSPFEFWDAAKLLPNFNQPKFQRALYELTRTDRREASPPRYELTAPARDLCWQLLGPPPEKEDAFWRYPDGETMERPKKEESVIRENRITEEPKPKRRSRKKG